YRPPSAPALADHRTQPKAPSDPHRGYPRQTRPPACTIRLNCCTSPSAARPADVGIYDNDDECHNVNRVVGVASPGPPAASKAHLRCQPAATAITYSRRTKEPLQTPAAMDARDSTDDAGRTAQASAREETG